MTERDPNDIRLFRPMVGFIAVVGSFAAFIGLFFVEIPARNENALMFAMGIIFGWGSAVFASEYGSSTTARKVTDSALKNLDRVTSAPIGSPEDPLIVAGPGGKSDAPPVQTETKDEDASN